MWTRWFLVGRKATTSSSPSAYGKHYFFLLVAWQTQSGAPPARRHLLPSSPARLQDQDLRNVAKSHSEFFGRSNRKIDKPAAVAPSQSRSGSSPTWRTSFGCSFINLSARR